MPAVRKIWHLAPFDRQAIDWIAKQANIPPALAQILHNRGVHDPSDVTRFLDAPLSGLHKPELLPGMGAAVDRLHAAVKAKEKVCIYGDYDVDGVTGTAILLGLLQQLGAQVEFYVPHRLEEGYGVNADALRQIAKNGCTLVVTVDCGIASLAEADVARELGLSLIITDHHEMKSELPKADVLVHPRLPGSSYPFGELSGAGVAFKLAWALAKRVSGSEKVGESLQKFLLDATMLATLGLIADVVPLHDENRIIVKHGLRRIGTEPSLGLRALMDASGLMKEKGCKAEDVAFKLAPRMNAAGRLGCARLVVEMLATKDEGRAREVAAFLESQNAQRQTLERRMTMQAKEMLEGIDLAGCPAAVLAHIEWHPGVIGIVASRIVEHIGRPALIIAIKEGSEVATGSGRSIPGFELHKALKACDADLIAHGGHSMACGFKIDPARIDSFRSRFKEYAAKHFPDGVPPAPRLLIDAELPLASLTQGFMKTLDKLEPFGSQNPKPRFLASGLKLKGEMRKIGADGKHLSCMVTQGGTTMRAVGWSMADRMEELASAGGDCCFVFQPTVNDWQGQHKIEMHISDLQAGATAKLA